MGMGVRSMLLSGAVLALFAFEAQALSFNLGPSPTRQLHLQVGSGGNGTNSLANNPVIDRLSTSVPLANVGNGVAQTFTTSNPNTIDPYPPVALTCTGGSAVLVSIIARLPTGSGTATLQANSSIPLSNAAGDTISFTAVRWTATDAGIPSGTFSGTAAQTLATVTTNNQIENCHTFSYTNARLVPAGTYTGRVTYTLSMP